MAYDYDAVIIGTGAGGGTAVWVLARAGWRVLMIERGPLFTDQTAWHDERRMIIHMEPFDDRIIWVNGREQRLYNGGIAGGGTALYGAALLRPSRDDFTPGRHYACLLPKHLWEWPILYEALAMYYDQAEDLYHVAADGGQPMPHLAERLTAYPRTPPALVAPQLTVVTSTTVQSSVAVSVSDARAARVVPSVAVAHETTAVRAWSSNGR